MATALEKYYGMKESMNAAIAQGKLPVEHLLAHQRTGDLYELLQDCPCDS